MLQYEGHSGVEPRRWPPSGHRPSILKPPSPFEYLKPGSTWKANNGSPEPTLIDPVWTQRLTKER